MKKILLISILSSFSSLSLAINEGSVTTTNTKGGGLVIESAKSESDADYFMSIDPDGVIMLTPSKPITDVDWLVSEEIMTTSDARNYCDNLPGSWRAPTTLETSTEIAKLGAMNENVKKFMNYGFTETVTAAAYFSGEGLKFGLIENQTVRKWFDADSAGASEYIHGFCVQM